MIILGIDPGLGTTGWGVIRAEGNRLSATSPTVVSRPTASRRSHAACRILDSQLAALIADHAPGCRRGRGSLTSTPTRNRR